MARAALQRPSEALAASVRRVALSLIANPITIRDYVLQGWDVIEPATPLQLNWHHELMLEHIEAAYNRQILRLVVNVPPRSLKSNFISILAPTWHWTRAPWERMVFSSYSQSLSTDLSVKRRRVIKSDWYQKNWGNVVKLADDQDMKTQFENDQTGTMITTSTGGSITGKGGGIITEDDPMNPKMAESDAEREAANAHHKQTLVSRLNDKKHDVMILIMQRLHALDTTGLVLAEGGWTHVDIQARADARRTYSFPISKKVKVVEDGEHLQPEREGQEEYERQRKAMGSRAHDAQYQQRPTSETGNIWKRHWWGYYTVRPEVFDALIQSWDMAFKDTDSSSYVVGQVWGLKGSKKFLLDQFRDRMDYPATKKAVINLSAKWPKALAKLVEDKANGPAIVADLEQTIPGMIAVPPLGGKTVRASAVAATIEAGDVYIPDPSIAPWVEDFVNECAAFPEAPNDDQVDAASQALTRLNEMVVVSSQEDEEEEEGNFLDREQDVLTGSEVFSND